MGRIISITTTDKDPKYLVETTVGTVRVTAKQLVHQGPFAKEVLNQCDRMWVPLHDTTFRIQVLEAAHA